MLQKLIITSIRKNRLRYSRKRDLQNSYYFEKYFFEAKIRGGPFRLVAAGVAIGRRHGRCQRGAPERKDSQTLE